MKRIAQTFVQTCNSRGRGNQKEIHPTRHRSLSELQTRKGNDSGDGAIQAAEKGVHGIGECPLDVSHAKTDGKHGDGTGEPGDERGSRRGDTSIASGMRERGEHPC
jgi:hypothetical protein